MRKILSLLTLMTMAAGAFADDLSDADRLYANKDFTHALPLYTKLAKAGNADAQEKLGEIYWFGDGVTVDINTAELWFSKAAAGGQEKARQFTEVIAQRKTRAADIDYYTTGFDGRDVKLSNFNCVQPEFPLVSKSKEEIKQLTDNMNQWQACYNRYVTHFNTALPAGSSIPKDLSALMNDQEMMQAVTLMDKRYTDIANESKQLALSINSKQLAWKQATEEYITAEAARMKLEQDQLQQVAMERRQESFAKQSGPMLYRATAK